MDRCQSSRLAGSPATSDLRVITLAEVDVEQQPLYGYIPGAALIAPLRLSSSRFDVVD